jgi:hypothetical protein
MAVILFNGVTILETDDEAVILEKIREFESNNPNRRAVRDIIDGVDTIQLYYRAPEPENG